MQELNVFIENKTEDGGTWNQILDEKLNMPDIEHVNMNFHWIRLLYDSSHPIQIQSFIRVHFPVAEDRFELGKQREIGQEHQSDASS